METIIFNIGLVWLTKKIEWTPDRVMFLYIVFGIAQAIQIATILFVRNIINKKADSSIIEVREKSFGQTRTIVPLGIMLFICYKFGTIIPLTTQIFILPQKLWTSNLVKAHLRGINIPRPFPPPPNQFASLLGLANNEPANTNTNTNTNSTTSNTNSNNESNSSSSTHNSKKNQ